MKWGSSLRQALAFNFIVLAALPVLVFGLFINYLWGNHLQRSAAETNRRLAYEVRSDAEFFLVEARRELEQIGKVLDQSGTLSRENLDDYLTTVTQNSLSFEALLLLDRNWQVVNLGLADEEIEQYRDFVGLDMSRHELHEGGALEQPRWSSPFLSLVSGNPTVTLGVPLREGVLLGNISLANLSDLITRLVDSAEYASLAIVGRDKSVIVSNRPQEVFEQVNFGYHPEVVEAFQNIEKTVANVHFGTKYLESVVLLPETGWVIWIGQDLDQVMTPAASLRATLAVFMLGAVVLAALAALRKSRLLMEPLQALQQRTAQIGAGTFDFDMPESRYVEVEELAAGMQEMASAIRVRQEHLRESEERFRLLFSLSPDATILARFSDGMIVDVNEVFLAATGLTREQAIGRSSLELELWPQQTMRDAFRERLRAQRQITNLETRIHTSQGDKDALISATLIELGETDYILAMVRDITEIRRAEADLLSSENRYQTVIDSIEEGLMVFDLGGEVIACNPAAEMVFGARDDLLGRPLRDRRWKLCREDGAPWTLEDLPVVRSLRWGEQVRREIMGVLDDDGGCLWIEGNSSPLRDARNQAITAAVVTFNNITERKQREELLDNIARGVSARTGTEFFHSLTLHLAKALQADYVLISEIHPDKPGHFRTISIASPWGNTDNIEYARMGTPCEDVVGRGICAYPDSVQRLYPDDPLLVEMGVEAYIGCPLVNEEGVALGVMAALYQQRLAETTLPEQLLQIFASRAMAELARRQSIAALQASEQFNRMLMQESPLPMIAINLDGSIRAVNAALEKLSGYAASALFGMEPPYPYWPDEKHDEYRKGLDYLMREEMVQAERLFRKMDGTPFWVDISGNLVTSEQGETFLLANWVDITARKEAEEALQKSEKQLRRLTGEFEALLEGIPDQILLVDRNYRLIWANHSPGDLDASYPQMCHQIFYQRETPCENCPVTRAFRTGTVEESDMDTPEGQHFSMRAVPILDASGEVEKVIQMVQDTTDKVRLQQRQQHTSQLVALGELAAGVAHEINNPVNGIINYAQLLKNRFGGEEQIGALCDRVISEGNRIATIVSELLYFAREGGDEIRITSWQQILEESLLLVGNQLRKDHIHLDVDLADDLPPIASIATQLQQVMLNLISNARHALNDKYPGEDDSKRLHITAQTLEGELVKLDITDLGPGIPGSLLTKVMQPFFTTKPAGIGTGLGLSICYEIVKRHGGNIEIFSEPGRFTRVSIVLPEGGRGRDPVSARGEDVASGLFYEQGGA